MLLLLQVQVDLLIEPVVVVVASTLAQTLQSFAIVVLCKGKGVGGERDGSKFGQMAAIKSLGLANFSLPEAGTAAALPRCPRAPRASFLFYACCMFVCLTL